MELCGLFADGDKRYMFFFPLELFFFVVLLFWEKRGFNLKKEETVSTNRRPANKQSGLSLCRDTYSLASF